MGPRDAVVLAMLYVTLGVFLALTKHFWLA